jgi:arylsulfatase/arylsulfatase A
MMCQRLRAFCGWLALLIWSALFPTSSLGAADRPPSILLIIADDMGYGDLGCHGNPLIRTPHLDKLAVQGVELTQFYVSPVCAPTRASLLTGRYNYRTGAVDTYRGRAMMHGDEVTLAERLGAAGYRCGIFGKWHLGDNYPMRAIDQGFHEALVHQGGGIGQPADPPGNLYTDPILQHNGKPVKTKGYCSDVFTDAAIKFISSSPPDEAGVRPFFAYLAFNCPHEPLQAPEGLLAEYKKLNLAHDHFPKIGQPLPGKANEDAIARVYAMVTNIDANVGRLLAKLDELKLAENTIVIFLTDNGPQGVRFNAGLRDRKGSVFDGGIRVPCFLRWPGKFPAGHKVDRLTAHIDITPTLLEACGATRPNPPRPPFVRGGAELASAPPYEGGVGGVILDGQSLLPLLKGEKTTWPDRTLFFQWHRGDEPELGRCFAARNQRWKLVQPVGRDETRPPQLPPPLLFDMQADPFETTDLATKHPDIAESLRRSYETWFKDVSATRGYAPPRIHLGAAAENPTTLTRQDWRGAGWGPKDRGHWEVTVVREGRYHVTLRYPAVMKPISANVTLGDQRLAFSPPLGSSEFTFRDVRLSRGDTRLTAWISAGEELGPVHYVVVERRE